MDLCLLTVHAHPDDEASKGACTVARYHDEGVRTVLVCCTGGEEGDIHNPAMDRPDVRARLHEVRREELGRSVEAIGYDELAWLGYRDSGMPGSEANHHPDAFAAADLEEAVGRLVALIRRHRPQVVVTYADDQRGYPHPDHIRVHDVSVPAFERAGDPDAYPEAGPPWAPSKLYYIVWTRARIEATHRAMLDRGLESPFPRSWFERPWPDQRITTRIDVADYEDVRRAALLAHATQIDPASPFWFGLPPEVARTVHPWDEYVLAASTVGWPEPGAFEDDLFAGVRSGHAVARPA